MPAMEPQTLSLTLLTGFLLHIGMDAMELLSLQILLYMRMDLQDALEEQELLPY